MLNTKNPLVQIKITSTVCGVFGILTTLYRLYIRRGRYGLDDLWAGLALLFLLLQIASVYMHVDDPTIFSRTTNIAAYYILAMCFYGVIWTSRISILFSIIRIDPSKSRKRLYTWVSYVFFLIFCILLAQLLWVCEPEPGWKDTVSPQCELGRSVAITQLVTDILVDGFLIVAPLRLVVRLRDKALRIKLMAIFSTCIVTTIVSLVHAYYILSQGGIKEVIAGIVEDNFSLIVCNLPVVVTALLHSVEGLTSRSNTARGTTQITSTVVDFAKPPTNNPRRKGSPSAIGGPVVTTTTMTVTDDDYPNHDTADKKYGINDPIRLDFMEGQGGGAGRDSGKGDHRSSLEFHGKAI